MNRFQNAGPKPESAATDKGVLAVISGASHALRNAGLDYTPLIEAHATVAEMVEALRAASVEMKRATHVRLPSYVAAQELVDATLARCKGGHA